ncbi:MAG TPA: adenylate/guanylate cyclase domain-containing protein [Methylomirabilota bacterium]|nr:adenylate/guanylate cyclase domain-containing protein [Methylomirabilota bacterium]
MPSVRPRPWQRLSVRVAAGFVAVTVLGIGLVGYLIYERQKQILQDTLATFLLNIARTGALLIDPALHAEVERTLTQDSEAYRRVRAALAAVQDQNEVATPIYTLTGFEESGRLAHFMVTSRGPGAPGEPYPLVPALLEPIGRAFREGVATHTRVYQNQSGTWITAFAPVRDPGGRVFAVLDVDYRVDVYLERLTDLRHLILGASLLGSLIALAVGLVLARRVTGPVAALTRGVTRVAGGDLSESLPVRSQDEVGQLTRAFNDMLEGLRQRDFIRDTFGRYVSPEIARTVLESPGGLRLGGEKRDVTILMSDLRGYTRFAERADPTEVVQVLNGYLGRMAEIVIEHGGTIDEFIGDAVFAVFGAPLDHPDHAERAAACAVAMQLAMEEVNQRHVARGLPRLEMGIGLNTGEAVVGNIGSEKRTKYGVVGSVVNLAARVEACTVGGQVLLSPSTYARVRDLAEVAPPMPVEMKGLGEPLLLYELRAIGGQYPRRLPEVTAEGGSDVPAALPLRCWVIEGKAVRPDPIAGEVTRLGRGRLEARLETPLPPLTNVRLRLRFPALAQDSGDLYGKVLAAEAPAGSGLVRIRITSVDTADQEILEGLVKAGSPTEARTG